METEEKEKKNANRMKPKIIENDKIDEKINGKQVDDDSKIGDSVQNNAINQNNANNVNKDNEKRNKNIQINLPVINSQQHRIINTIKETNKNNTNNQNNQVLINSFMHLFFCFSFYFLFFILFFFD